MAIDSDYGGEQWQSWKTFIIGWHNAQLTASQMVALLFEQGFYADVTRLEQWIAYWELDQVLGIEEELTTQNLDGQGQPRQKSELQVMTRECSTKSATPTSKSAGKTKSNQDIKSPVNSKVASPTYSLFPQHTYRHPLTTPAPSIPRTRKRPIPTSPCLRPMTAPAVQAASIASSPSSSRNTTNSQNSIFSAHERKDSACTSYSVASEQHSFMHLDQSMTGAGSMSDLTLDAISLHSLSLGRPVTPDVTAGQLPNLPRTLAKMEAAEHGLPMISCCCADFFSGTKDSSNWTPLYQMLLEDPDYRQTLHYTRAVARLCRTASVSVAMESRLEEQYHYHNELLDRQDVRNDAAYAITLELASLRDGFMPDKQAAVLFAQRVMREVYGQEKDICTAVVEIREKYSHLYEGIRKLPIQLRTSRNPSNWRDARSLPRRRFEDELTSQLDATWLTSLLTDCREVITHPENLSSLASYASTLKPWSFQDGHIHARQQLERVNIIRLGREIRDILITNIDLIPWPKASPRHIKMTMLVFDAIGFIVSQAFHQHNSPSQLNEDQAFTHLLNAAGILNVDSKFKVILTGDIINMNTKLLQAMWICDNRPLFGPQGLHVEACQARSCWKILGGNVEQFDKPTTLTAPTALPAKLMPTTGKNKPLPQPKRSGFNKLKDLVRFKQKGGFQFH